MLSNDIEIASNFVLSANNRSIIPDRTLKEQGIHDEEEIHITQQDENSCENSDVEEEFLIVHSVL